MSQETEQMQEQSYNPGRHFEYADLVYTCNCGHKNILQPSVKTTQTNKEGVEEGVAIQVILTPFENSVLKLVCEECKQEVTLRFEENLSIVEAEILADESVQEAGDKAEQVTLGIPTDNQSAS